MAITKNCNTCGKQNICPKAKHIENYRMGASCMDHEWPDGTIFCSHCGSPMEWMGDYHHPAPYERMITGDVYHCTNEEECGEDEVIEKTWQYVSTCRRKYFHG